jgi:hypothetical protein
VPAPEAGGEVGGGDRTVADVYFAVTDKVEALYANTPRYPPTQPDQDDQTPP